jgi:hypothetical protein
MDLPEELPSSQELLNTQWPWRNLRFTERLRASTERCTKFHLNIDGPLAAVDVLPHLLRISEAIIASPCITELSISRIKFSTLHIIQAILEQLAVGRPASLQHLKLNFGRRRDPLSLPLRHRLVVNATVQ